MHVVRAKIPYTTTRRSRWSPFVVTSAVTASAFLGVLVQLTGFRTRRKCACIITRADTRLSSAKGAFTRVRLGSRYASLKLEIIAIHSSLIPMENNLERI